MAGIADIRFLTRPVRGYAGGDLVINPPTAAEELETITTFKPSEFYKNLAKSADWKAGAEHVEDWATGKSIDILGDQIAEEMRAKGIKITFDWEGFKNWMMGKDAQGNKKTFSPKENRRAVSKFLKKIPGSSTRRFFLNSLIKGGIKFSSPAAEAIQKYFERSEYVKKITAKGQEIDEAIAQIDPDLIKNMTGKDLQIYLKDNFDLDVTNRTMYRKIRKKKIPIKSNIDWEIGSKVKKALDEIGNTENLTPAELWAKPQIQKIAKEGFLTPETLNQLRYKLGYPIERRLVDYFDKLGADHDEIVKYITNNNPTPSELNKKFPKLQQAIDEGKVKQSNINVWRLRNELSHVPGDLKSAQQLKRAESLRLKRKLHIPSSKDIENISPVIRDAVQKELDKGQVESYHPAMVKHRGDVSGIGSDRITLQNYATKGRKEAAYEIGTDLRNKLHVQFENWIPTVTAKKNKLISQFKNNEIAKDDFLGSLEEINNDLNLAKADMEKLGLMSKLFNPRTRRKEYFGKPYNNTLDLIKDIRNEYNFFSEVGKKHGMLGGKEKIPGLKKEKYNQGGMVGMDYLTRPI